MSFSSGERNFRFIRKRHGKIRGNFEEGKFWPLTKQKNSGEVLSNLLLSAGKRAAHSFDI